jgi:glucose-1-phosphate thymidylyltransferase
VWGVIPAAGRGTRIQPLGFSKELLPVGSHGSDNIQGTRAGQPRRTRAVAEYLVERMMLGGADKICFIISPGKSDIMEYFGASYRGANIAYVVQPEPVGLCDAIFRARTVTADEPILVGLPDTVWFPEDGLAALPIVDVAFLLFPVERPQDFDAVVIDGERVREIQVKQPTPSTHWVWGAFRLSGKAYAELYTLWLREERHDEYFGTLVNAYLEKGGKAFGFRHGQSYVDVGTLDGYRAAIQLLDKSGEGEDLSVKAAYPNRRSSHSEARPVR